MSIRSNLYSRLLLLGIMLLNSSILLKADPDFSATKGLIPISAIPSDPDSLKSDKKLAFFGMALSGGLSISTGNYKYISGAEPPMNSFLLSPTGSLGFDLRFGKIFSIRSDIRYHSKGDHIQIQNWLDQLDQDEDQGDWITPTAVSNGSVKTTVNYIEVSLVPTFHLGAWVHFGFGAYAGVGLSGREISDFTIEYYVEDHLIDIYSDSSQRTIMFELFSGVEDTEEIRYFNMLDYGVVGILGFGHKPLTLDLSFQYGLESWQSETDLFGYTINPDKTQHLGLMVSASYWFL